MLKCAIRLLRGTMEQRTVERIPANVEARFFYGDVVYSGVVENLSTKGMFIRSEISPPINERLEVLLLFKDEIIKVPVKIKSFQKTETDDRQISVEILLLPKKYWEFVNALKL